MGLLERMDRQRKLQQKDDPSEETKNSERRNDAYDNLKAKIHQKVIDEINKRQLEVSGKELSGEIISVIEAVVST